MSAKKIILMLLGVFFAGLLVLGVVLALLVPRWIEEQVVAAAEQRGIALTPGDIRYGWGWAQVTDSRLTFTGVRGLQAEVGIIDVALDGLTPRRFTVNRVQAEATAELSALSREFESWAAAHRSKLREPLYIKPLSFRQRDHAKAAPGLVLEGGELQLDTERWALQAGRCVLFGRELGALRVAQQDKALRLNLTLGVSALDNPVLLVEIDDGSTRALHVSLSPVSLERLGKLAGAELGLADVLVSGSLDASVPNNLAVGGRVQGKTDLLLKGYVPPHPVELNGFVFGDTTAIGAKWTLEPERLRVLIQEASVQAARFKLKGNGELRWEGDHGRLLLTLRGQLPCPELAGAMAESRLGRALGRVSGKAARQVLTGTVGVHVSVDAQTQDLEKARVLKTISAGCGLKPLSLQELAELGELVPEALDPAVLRDFAQLLDGKLPAFSQAGDSIQLKLPKLDVLGLPTLPTLDAPVPSKPPTPSGGKAPKKNAAPASSDAKGR